MALHVVEKSSRGVRLTPLDYILLALLAGGIFYVVYRISTNLDYSWQWGSIPQYLFRYDEQSGSWQSNYLIHGLMTTIRLSIWASIPALFIGIGVALARTSISRYWQIMGRGYVELMRNLPPLVIVFIVFYFLADQILPQLGITALIRAGGAIAERLTQVFIGPPESAESFLAAVFSLAVFEAAYVAEILRSGIRSVADHQFESASALGFSRWQAMRYIILPQAVRKVLPPLGGQFISLIKDSSIVSIISIQELSYQGTQLMASTYMTIEVWSTVAMLYLVLTLTCSLFVRRLEQKSLRYAA